MSESNVAVLLVEDNRDLAATVGMFLENEGYQVEYASNGEWAYEMAQTEEYDVIVLDIMLPKMDGFEVCRRLRTDANIDTPILMLTARDQLDDKSTGFSLGADDYLVKPFDLPELSMRIKAMVRRMRGDVIQSVLQVGTLILDDKNRSVTRDGQPIKLTPVGYRILKILMRSSPNVVKRKDLIRELWGDELPDTDALRSHLYQLRKMVDKPFDSELIRTVAGVGFQVAEDG